jgi:hypothetical protein
MATMLGMTIKREAERFMREYGEFAYDKVREAIYAARKRRNARLEQFLTKVARVIEIQAEKIMKDTIPNKAIKPFDDQ